MARLQDEPLTNIISSPHDLVRRNVGEFLKIRDEITSEPKITDFRIFHQSQSEKIENFHLQKLKCCVSTDKIAIAFWGGISSGKTTFVHLFLKIGRILPSGGGPTAGRITKLTYAPAEQTCIRLYKTIRDRTINEEISLAPFFANGKPDWLGVRNVLSEYVKRPEGMDEISEEFARWARCFVEIHLPSPTLAQGIDVYDTSGFLVGEAPVFAEILYDLVELVHPTIVFMFENPWISDATTRSFLALHDIDHSRIFFLNSKADVDRMTEWNGNMTKEEFSVVLARERAQRYELLRHAPFLAAASLESLPASIDQCRNFDICSALSQPIKPFGPLMNENAIQRITQFAVNENSASANRRIQLALSKIDSFFDFLTTSNPRTREELTALKTDAMNWTSRYFQAFTLYTDRFLSDLFANISQRFDTDKRSIMERFRGHSWFSEITEKEVLDAVTTVIVRPSVHQAVTECIANLLTSIESSLDLYPNVAHNEIFIEAINRQEISSLTASLLQGEGTDNGRLYMVNTISTPIIACTTFPERCSQLTTSSSRRAETSLSGASRLRFLSSREAIISPLISRCREKLEKHQLKLREAVQLSGRHQERMLRVLIEQHYNPTSPRRTCHQEALQRLQQYSARLMKIACELRAAHDMATFLGQPPRVHNDARPSSMFTIFTADWGNENNLTVKKITQPSPDPTHDEAHHHRRVALLQHPHIFNLRYLYRHTLDHQTSELWMIFPPIFSTIDQFLRENLASLSVEQLFHWMADIADALKALHAHGLLHRNVNLRNLLLTEDGKVLLADLDDGIHKDIKGLGVIGTVLKDFLAPQHRNSPILGEFDDLMASCVRDDCNQTMTADIVHQKLRSLLMTI